MSIHDMGADAVFGNETGVRYYPSDLDQGPFMKFTTYSIKGGVGSSMSDINFGGPFQHVCLPIPSGLNTTYGQGWDQEDTGQFATTIGAALEGGKSGAQGSDDSVVAKGVGTAKGAVSKVMESLTSAGVEDTLAAGLLGVVGKVTKGAAQRATGLAVFNNTYATYGGPAFREFSFAFSLKALSASDTDAIWDIVRFFKLNSAPQLRTGGLWRLYELPMVFAPSFHTKTGAMNFNLPRITKCALTNVGVTYGGDKYSEFTNNAPVQVDLTLSFKEIALLSGIDIDAGF